MDVEYRVELRDRSFNMLEVLENEITFLSWDYSRIGGCGSFKFSIPRKYCDEKFISGDFNVRIYIRSSAGTYDLWYQGLIENKNISVKNKEQLDISGHGYSSQLSRINIDKDFTSQTIEYIVDDVIDDVVADTDITKGTISATGFTADTLEFNTTAQSVIESCSDIVGTREWGVDENREFYFKERSSTVGFNFPLGGKVTSLKEDQAFKDIVNNIIVQGAVDDTGTSFTYSKADTKSQEKYGKREKVLQNSNVSTDTVAEQLADAVLAEYRDVIRKASCSLVNYSTRIEDTIPIPLFKVKRLAKTLGTEKYGTFLYAGEIEYQINRIKYQINENSVLSIDLDLGFLRPSLAEQIAQLEYKLEQLRSDSL